MVERSSMRNRFQKFSLVGLFVCFAISAFQSASTYKLLAKFEFKSPFDYDIAAVLPSSFGDDSEEEVDDDHELGYDDGTREENEYDDDDSNDDDDDDANDGGNGDEEENTSVDVSTEIKKSDPSEETERKEEVVAEEETSRQDNSKMNVLLFYPDDWRHDSIGSEKPYVFTPFLDQLAKEGIRFTHNAVTTSICWMSRATLWMGQYTSRHQSYKLKCPIFAKPENWKHSWVSMLRNSGYFVGHIGKWQYNNDFRPFFNFSRPFEGRHWYQHKGKLIDGSTLGRIFADEFFGERPKDKPFALSIAFYPPKPVGVDRDPPGAQWKPTNETRRLYDNITIPEPEMNNSYKLLPDFLSSISKGARGPQVRWWERYRTSEHYQASMKNYYALITGVDQACKEIVDRLKEEGLYNNTMIIFTTDNGMMHGAHGLAGKWYPFQESIRVPLIVYDPRMPKEKVGTLDDSFTLNIDLAETILGAAGLKPDEQMQGRDISDLYLPNEKNEHHATSSVNIDPWREDFFYEFPFDSERFIASSTALVTRDWKYINWPLHNREQLFYLDEDPLEFNDLYNDTQAKPMLDKLRERHNELRSEYHESNWLEHTCFGGPGLESEKIEE